MSTNKSRMLKSLASRSADAQSAPRAPRRAGPPSTSATASSSRPASRPRPPTQPKPTPIPLRRHTPYVVYEDEKQLVLNKPAGVAIQGEHWTSARMMWDNLLEDLHQRPASPRTYPVHRLDKSTSGALILAKTSAQAKNLSTQLASRQVSRTYLSVVHGCIQPGFAGEIDTSLRVDDDQVRTCRPEDEGGVGAMTKWECLEASTSYSLLALRPSTGRKHQLRVHVAETLKAPIVGDYKYGPDSPHKALSPLPSDTILLHAAAIQFFTFDRATGKRNTIDAKAPPPSAFVRFCTLAGLTIPPSYL